jgi:hypothetical protein
MVLPVVPLRRSTPASTFAALLDAITTSAPRAACRWAISGGIAAALWLVAVWARVTSKAPANDANVMLSPISLQRMYSDLF